MQLNLVLLTSSKFFLLCYRAKVIPVQWLSWKLSCAEEMTLLANLVIELKCQNVEHLPFGILETTMKKLSSKPCKPCLLFAVILWTYGFSVTCNVTLKCYVTAETSPGNYARCAVRTSLKWEMFETYFVIAFLGRKARNSEMRFFSFHSLSRIWICWSDLFGIYTFSVILWVK